MSKRKKKSRPKERQLPPNSPPKHLGRQSARQIVELERHEEYEGPIPPSAELAKYEQVLPGAADRILKMAESQSGHRHQMEKAGVASYKHGLYIGALIALAAIVAATYMAVEGQEKIGLLGLGLFGLASIISRFVPRK